MIRGTTPTHIFDLSIDTEIIDKIRIIYAQDDVPLFVKERDECKFDNSTVTVKLSQNETLLFNCLKDVQIQIRVLTSGGDALSTPVRRVSIEKCLESEVLE